MDMRRVDMRKVVPVLVVVGLALGVAALALTLRDDDGGGGSDRKTSAASSTSTSTTAAPTTTSATLPPGTTPGGTPPAQTPATALPPGTVVVAPTQPPPPTVAPPTVAPPSDSSASETTTAPTTTAPTTTSTATPPADVERDTVVYSPPDAPKRRGDLLVPDDHHSTAIVLIHGGQGVKGSRKNARPWADAYADAGYLTFSIDYFLFNDATPPPVFPTPERDVKAAVQYLRQHADDLGIDPDRILVQGFSAGARLGAEAYTSGDDPSFAGEGLYDDGTSDVVNGFIGFYGPYNGNQAEAEQYYGGPRDSDDPEVQARYARADSIAHAADAGGPALLFQGDADELVPVGQATEFGDALTAAGKNATVAIVPGADHGFDREKRDLTPEGEAAFAQILDWLAQEFPPSD